MFNSWVDVISFVSIVLIALVIVGDIVLAVFKNIWGIEKGTTWSELLRESIGITTLIPWSLGVWVGRWFPILPPEHSIKLSIGLPVVLGLSAIVTVVGDILMRRMRRPIIPPWSLVLSGLIAGGLLIPLAQIY